MKDKIFIYGVPGSGKTYISELLFAKLNWPLFEADTIRSKIQEGKNKESDPFVFVGTNQAYKYFGELNPEHAIRGLKAVRNALQGEVVLEVNKYDKVIVEGAFLDPNIFIDQGWALVVTKDESKHEDQFFKHRPENNDTLIEFQAARIIQEYLLTEAQKLNVNIIENDQNIGSSISSLIDKVV